MGGIVGDFGVMYVRKSWRVIVREFVIVVIGVVFLEQHFSRSKMRYDL